jgi:S1-C subfamily serine protease
VLIITRFLIRGLNLFTKLKIAFTAAVALTFAMMPSSQGFDTPKSPQTEQILSQEDIPNYLQDISVTIHSHNSQGSGVLINRGESSYVLTCGHVVEDLRSTRTVIDPKTGSSRVKIEFGDAKIVKEVYDEEGRSVGRLSLDAEVVRYSDANNGEDLSLLRLRKKDFVKTSAKFFKVGEKGLSVGTDLIHVGSLLGQQGSNSVTTGIISQHGRVINGKVYDQSTCAAFPGSSGGGLYRKSDGLYVGMLVRGAGETFNLYVPIRRIHTWAKRVGVDFILNETLPVPSDKDLVKVPVEEISGEGRDTSAYPKHNKDFPFLIKPIKAPTVIEER